MKKLLLLSAVLVGATSASYAGVSFNFNLGGPPVYAAPPASVIISHPAPVIYQPAQPPICETPTAYQPAPPVCETPAPVVYQPQSVCEPQVVVAPPPVVCEPAPRMVIAPRPVYHPAPRVVVVPERHGDYRHSRDYAYNDHRKVQYGNERYDSHNRDRRF